MKDLCERELNNLVKEISITYFNKPFRHQALYNYRLRTTGGRYLLSSHNIEINPKYMVEMTREDYKGIIKHELCHYHLHLEGKGYRHGDQDFKELLKQVGAPRHCRPLPSQENTVKYIYLCEKCHLLYRRKRRVNTKKYRCGKCKGKIRLKNRSKKTFK